MMISHTANCMLSFCTIVHVFGLCSHYCFVMVYIYLFTPIYGRMATQPIIGVYTLHMIKCSRGKLSDFC